MIRFDIKRKHGTVYGDEVENPKRPRKYWQGGVYFDAEGFPVDQPRPAKASEPVPAAEPVKVVELKEKPGTDALEALQKMTVPALKKLAAAVHEASGAELPENGTGVKARLIAYIAENTD
jgi:hypothetical protein